MQTKIPKTALLLIDCQVGFLGNSFGRALGNLNHSVKIGLFSPVIASLFTNSRSSPFVRFLGWNHLMTNEEQALPNNFPFQLDKAFIKTGYSAFTDEMNVYLGLNQVDRIAIAGVDTEGCVLATALDLFSHNYEPFIFSDCCFSTGGSHFHEAALMILQRTIGTHRVVQFGDYLKIDS